MYRRAGTTARTLLVLVALLLQAGVEGVAAQIPSAPLGARGVIQGVVLDSAAGSALNGATVAIVGTRRGTTTGETGRFELPDLYAGLYVVRVRQLGYATQERSAIVRGGETTTVTIRLVSTPVTLAAVRARARSTERERFELRPNVGTVSLTPSAVSNVPSLGEPDVLRAVQLLPGVNARNDFSSGYNVRGGESDQNLILLDGYPIYNPFHLGGLFSTFLDETVSGVDLLTGGFGAAYGGRLSSVLDVHSADASRSGLHGTAGISVIASSLSLGSASDDGRGSWMLSGRRTYADKLVSALSDKTFPYHFSDAQLHASRKLGDGNMRVELTAYSGADVLDGDFATFGDSAGSPGGGTFTFDWENQLVGLTVRDAWHADESMPLLGGADSVLAEQRISFTRFGTGLDLGKGALTLSNSVHELRVAGSVRWLRGTHERQLGYEGSGYAIRYDVQSAGTGTTLFSLAQHPSAAAAFYQEGWRPTARLVMEGGLRAEHLTGRGWTGLSPRVSAKYFITPDLAISAAFGEYAQWLHSLNREDIPVRVFDFWVASDAYVEVSRARHYVLGVERWLGALRFARVEGWVKQYDHLLEQNTADDPSRRGDEFLDSRGSSYGVDILLRQLDLGAFGGWVAYTYGVSPRQRDGVSYWPGHDRRHNLNVVATYKPGDHYLFSARMGVASGTPYTDIVGQIVRRVYDPTTNSFGSGSPITSIEPVGGTRNGARYPFFQRLDLSVSRESSWRGMRVTPYLSVVNAYNAKNVFIYTFDYTRNPPTREASSQFPLLPSLGMTVAF